MTLQMTVSCSIHGAEFLRPHDHILHLKLNKYIFIFGDGNVSVDCFINQWRVAMKLRKRDWMRDESR
jgi:hypothetical protein